MFVSLALLLLQPPYPGAEPDAAWRAAAQQRIEAHRMAPLAITVLDARGRPAPDTEVRVRQTRHAFGFGTAVAAQLLLAQTPDAERYRRALLDNFNMVVFENDLKWPQWEANRTRPLEALDWLHANGITRVRGHVLVWPGWRWLPASLKPFADQPEALRQRVLARIEDAVSATRGRLADWDVVNEPYSNKDLLNILGFHEMVAWFRAARAHDPNVRLFLNDYDIIGSGGQNRAHQDHFFHTLRYLLDHGAPLDGIGIQGHFSRPTPPARVIEILDRFASLGKPIVITEFDFNTPDQALQAQFTRDLLTAVFSHPAVTDFLMWGFWEGRHWRPAAAMFRRDWSAKPNHDVWRDLVFRQWWTDTTARTGPDGRLVLRAFLGAYEITAGPAIQSVELPAAGAAVKIAPRP